MAMQLLSPMFAGSPVSVWKGRSVRKLAVLFVFLAFAALASAQEATIVGSITDPTGAAVPNVSITITNAATGQQRQLSTNSEGQYVAPDLRIGHYSMRVQG